MSVTISVVTGNALPAAIAPQMKTICDFVAHFPDGDLDKLASAALGQLVKNCEEADLPVVLQHDPQWAFHQLREICLAVMKVGVFYKDAV